MKGTPRTKHEPLGVGHEASRLSIRRLAGATLAAVALGAAAPAAQAGDLAPPNPVETPLGPHLEIGAQDAFVGKTDPATALSKLQAIRDMGATRWRVQINPRELKRNGWTQYDQAIDLAAEVGLEPIITVGFSDVHWNKKKIDNTISSIAVRYTTPKAEHPVPLVKEISPGNEPNYRGWLIPMHGKTLPQTYRYLYQESYKVIKKINLQTRVLYGEFSSHRAPSGDTPTEFMAKVAMCPRNEITCEPIIADGVAYHPYQLTSSPKRPSTEAGEQGIGSLEAVQNEIRYEVATGQLVTPDGRQMRTYLNEFAYWTPTRNETADPKIPIRIKSRYLPEQKIASNYRYILQMLCEEPEIASISQYGVVSPPLHQLDDWNTALFTSDGRPLAQYLAIQAFAQQRPDCIIQPPANRVVASKG